MVDLSPFLFMIKENQLMQYVGNNEMRLFTITGDRIFLISNNIQIAIVE